MPKAKNRNTHNLERFNLATMDYTKEWKKLAVAQIN